MTDDKSWVTGSGLHYWYNLVPGWDGDATLDIGMRICLRCRTRAGKPVFIIP